MLRLRIISFLILLPVSTGMIVSCAGSIYPDVERGTEYYFREGFPEVRISALGFLDAKNKGIIRIAADLVNESLIYREEEGITFAEIGIEIRVVGTEQTDHSETFTTSLKIDRNYEGYEASPGLVQFKKEMNAPPGRYEIHHSVVDLTSNKNTTRTTETFIPDPAADQVHLTSVQLLGKYRDTYWPVTTYDVSTANDSIRFVFQVTNNRPETPLTVVSKLLRFDADTDPARP
ncbi:MAG: hypothetical protein R3281_17245, partial [Balneolaceae bacterium]|nr:hypothetical protein [Balneolaceae bacterium]